MEPTSSWLEDVLPRYSWRPGVSRCYEVWYGKLNYEHAGASSAFWFRYEMLTHPFGEPARADLWGIHYNGSDPGENFHVHETFPIAEVRVLSDAASVKLARGAFLAWDEPSRSVRVAGSSKAPAASLSWDLSFAPREPGFRYVWPSFLARALARSNACTPFEDVRYGGLLELALPGRAPQRRQLGDCPGMLGHIWGSRHADGWCWLHANRFQDEAGRPVEAALEALTLVRAGRGRSLTTVFFRLGDAVFRANGPFALARSNRGEPTREGFRLQSEYGDLKLEARVTVDASRAQSFELTDTDGSKLTNTSSLLADVELLASVGEAGPPRRLVCKGAAALEKVQRT